MCDCKIPSNTYPKKHFTMHEKAKFDFLEVDTNLPPMSSMSTAMLHAITTLCSVMVEQTVADLIDRTNKSVAEQPT